MGKLMLIGHRGARGLAPENTLLALDAGIAAGASWLEFDVQLHPSGELALLHDLTLDRTTSGRGRFCDMAWESLRQLDAGQGQHLPTLDEALDLIDQRAGVNVELKSWDGTAAAVAARLRERIAAGWPAEKFMVSSFHLPELYEFRQVAPEIPIGVLLCGVPLDWAAVASELQASALNISAEFVDPRLIADARSRGLALYVYTVNELSEARQLLALGVDGVFTDFPDRLAALCA